MYATTGGEMTLQGNRLLDDTCYIDPGRRMLP
jgi:hypothetical protein